jgi:hypothetical protein
MNKSVLNKVLNKTYSFPKSRSDMETLRTLIKSDAGESGNKELTDWKYYASVFNICTEFGEQLLSTISFLDSFNNRVCDMQEEYMPSGPPMSPVTTSFFATWMALDAPIDERLTLGLLYQRYIQEKKTMLYAEKAMENFNASYISFYQVTAGDLRRPVLWDIIEKREIIASLAINDYAVATYKPLIGDIWYARILPPLGGEEKPYVAFGTPLVFRATGRKAWEDFFSRQSASIGGGLEGIRNYLKRGNSFGYWLEFVFQTYAGHSREVIFAEGLPDIAQSRPHSDLDKGRMS